MVMLLFEMVIMAMLAARVSGRPPDNTEVTTWYNTAGAAGSLATPKDAVHGYLTIPAFHDAAPDGGNGYRWINWVRSTYTRAPTGPSDLSLIHI